MNEALFNNKDALAEGWYVIARSKEVKKGKVIQKTLLNKNFAVFRGHDGQARVLLAKCPHMGASLGQGTVKGNHVVCAFHSMHFDGDGKCAYLPVDQNARDKYSATAFKVKEAWGQIWFHLGENPKYELSVFDKMDKYDFLLFGRAEYQPHHHVMIPNALDHTHFDVVHGLRVRTFDFEHKELSLRAHINFEITERAPPIFRFFRLKTMELIFECFGGNNYMVEILAPFKMSFLTNYSPKTGGGTISSTAAFFPHRPYLLKMTGIPLLIDIVKMSFINAFYDDDVKVIKYLDFTPKFLPSDKYYLEFIKHCGKLNKYEGP